ncbi:MAG: hypothetical protein KBG96_02575, partial [Paludibacter sp.]|nr:hypothetical protein [Paludibacter sp.]
MLYPDHFEQKTDFISIRRLLKDKCLSALGAEQVDLIQFETRYDDIVRMLNQTDEMLQVLTNEGA